MGGETVKDLYDVQCIADGMDFKLSAGVGGTDGAFACVDENDGGCPTEEYILCAFDQASNMKSQIHYLACMDEYDGDAPSPRTPAQAAAQAQSCAQRLGLTWSSIESCVSGSRGTEMLQQAHTYYEANKDKIRGFQHHWSMVKSLGPVIGAVLWRRFARLVSHVLVDFPHLLQVQLRNQCQFQRQRLCRCLCRHQPQFPVHHHSHPVQVL